MYLMSAATVGLSRGAELCKAPLLPPPFVDRSPLEPPVSFWSRPGLESGENPFLGVFLNHPYAQACKLRNFFARKTLAKVQGADQRTVTHTTKELLPENAQNE